VRVTHGPASFAADRVERRSYGRTLATPHGQLGAVNSASRGRRVTGSPSRRATRVFARSRKAAVRRGCANISADRLGRTEQVVLCMHARMADDRAGSIPASSASGSEVAPIGDKSGSTRVAARRGLRRLAGQRDWAGGCNAVSGPGDLHDEMPRSPAPRPTRGRARRAAAGHDLRAAPPPPGVPPEMHESRARVPGLGHGSPERVRAVAGTRAGDEAAASAAASIRPVTSRPGGQRDDRAGRPRRTRAPDSGLAGAADPTAREVAAWHPRPSRPQPASGSTAACPRPPAARHERRARQEQPGCRT
jgi:hypothetical protein